MNNVSQQLPTLDEYVDLQTLLRGVGHTFPSQDSLKWFVRRHRSELVTAGALINITGRLKFHPLRFQHAAVDIGRNSACANQQ